VGKSVVVVDPTTGCCPSPSAIVVGGGRTTDVDDGALVFVGGRVVPSQ
jgi:hypothetical protein